MRRTHTVRIDSVGRIHLTPIIRRKSKAQQPKKGPACALCGNEIEAWTSHKVLCWKCHHPPRFHGNYISRGLGRSHEVHRRDHPAYEAHSLWGEARVILWLLNREIHDQEKRHAA